MFRTRTLSWLVILLQKRSDLFFQQKKFFHCAPIQSFFFFASLLFQKEASHLEPTKPIFTVALFWGFSVWKKEWKVESESFLSLKAVSSSCLMSGTVCILQFVQSTACMSLWDPAGLRRGAARTQRSAAGQGSLLDIPWAVSVKTLDNFQFSFLVSHVSHCLPKSRKRIENPTLESLWPKITKKNLTWLSTPGGSAHRAGLWAAPLAPQIRIKTSNNFFRRISH